MSIYTSHWLLLYVREQNGTFAGKLLSWDVCFKTRHSLHFNKKVNTLYSNWQNLLSQRTYWHANMSCTVMLHADKQFIMNSYSYIEKPKMLLLACSFHWDLFTLNYNPDDGLSVDPAGRWQNILQTVSWWVPFLPLRVQLNLSNIFFLRVLEGAEIPASRAEHASLETGLPFSDAVDLPEDGASQQDVDPRVQDLVTGCHPDTRHHQPPIGVFVTAQGATVGACGWHQSKDLKK